MRRSTRQIAPRAGQRRRALAVARSPLTRQIVALGLALSVVALSLAYPVRSYLQQQAAERAAVAEQHQLQGTISDLKAQVSALKDPAYIRAEAKRRLQYVTPGDTIYVVKVPAALSAGDGADSALDPGAATAGASSKASSSASSKASSKASSEASSSGTSTASTSPSAGGHAGPAGQPAQTGQTADPDVTLPWYSTLWDTMSGR